MIAIETHSNDYNNTSIRKVDKNLMFQRMKKKKKMDQSIWTRRQPDTRTSDEG